MKKLSASMFEARISRAFLRGFKFLGMSAVGGVLAVSQLACTNSRVSPVVRGPAASVAVGQAGTTARPADFGSAHPSTQARQMADGILRSGDHRGADFAIIDKTDAFIYVFAANGMLRGSSAVLLGLAFGDDSVPDIGSRPIAAVRPEERTTPAGRFVAERGRNTSGEDVIWVDYDAAVSMHRVRATNPLERRLERLATPTPNDNRISYGCINIPVAFYEAVVSPTFSAQGSLVYVLPEVRQLTQVFPFTRI